MQYAVYRLIIHALSLFFFIVPQFFHVIVFYPAPSAHSCRYSVYRFIHDEYIRTVMSVQSLIYTLSEYLQSFPEAPLRPHVFICFFHILFQDTVRSICILLTGIAGPSEIMRHNSKTPVSVLFRIALIHMLEFILGTHHIRSIKPDEPVYIIRSYLHFLLQEILYVLLKIFPVTGIPEACLTYGCFQPCLLFFPF